MSLNNQDDDSKNSDNSAATGFSFPTTVRPISPSNFNFKTDDTTKTTKCKLEYSSGMFRFSGKKKSSVDKKSKEGFNFVFSGNLLPSSSENNSNSPTQSQTLNANGEMNLNNFQSVFGSDRELRLEQLENLNIKMDNIDTQNEQSKMSDDEKQSNDETREKTDEEIDSIKILFKEFKGMVNEFVRERENEKRIAALEKRVETLEEEIKVLKEKEEKNSPNNEEKENKTDDINEPSTCAPPIKTPFAFNTKPITGFGSSTTFSSTASTPSNFVFGTATFSNDSTTSNRPIKSVARQKKILVPATQIQTTSSNNAPKSSNSFINLKKENHNLFNIGAIESSALQTTSNSNLDGAFSMPNKTPPTQSEEKEQAKSQELPGLTNIEKAIRESVEKAVREAMVGIKSTLAENCELSKKN